MTKNKIREYEIEENINIQDYITKLERYYEQRIIGYRATKRDDGMIRLKVEFPRK